MAEHLVEKKLERKEAIILAIDVGKNSKKRGSDGKTYFEKSIKCASMILKRKILTESEDHLAIILFGSSHTINHLSSEGSCYGGIETFAGLGIPTWDLFNRVNSLSPTNVTPSDWISTFVLASDFLKNETENKVFAGLQIVMFSNLATDISFHNTDTIAKCLKVENLRLTILGTDYEAISLNCASDAFLKKTKAIAVNFDSVQPKISYYKQKEVIARSWNAPLSFKEVFDIKVFGYQKIDITTKSSNWLFSKNYDTQDLTTEKKKHSDGNGEEMEVDNDLPMGNFNFGDHIIPAIDLDTDECTYIVAGQRSLQVLGYVQISDEQLKFLLGGVSYIFQPHKTDKKAFNSVFKYMVLKRKVMLVRRVDLYINLLNIGVLIPQKEENEKFFVYVNLPYDDEKNDTYGFPSLDSTKSHLKENIALTHTDAMDIDIGDRNKYGVPIYQDDTQLQFTFDSIVKQISTKVIPKKIPYLKRQRIEYRRMMENGGPRLQDFLNRVSFKPEFFENFPSAANLIYKDPDEQREVSRELRRSRKRLIKKAQPPLNELGKTSSVEQEVLENSSAEDNNTIHFGYDKELNGSNELINRPKTLIENDEQPLNKFKKTFSIKEEVFENGSAEDINTIHFGYDEELDATNELINHPKTLVENDEPPLNELKTTFSIKQEIFDNGSAEDINSMHFGYDEELDATNELINHPKTLVENDEPPLNELKTTFSIKQEIFDNGSAEDINTIHFGYDEELDAANELINHPKTLVENYEPPLNELKTTFSIKQEIFDNGSAEDINTIHFGYDEELDATNELIYHPKTLVEKDEPPLNELKTTFSIKQEIFENGSAEDINSIHFGYDEELDAANELINHSKTSVENDEPPLNELKTTFSIKQEIFENSLVEDNNSTKVDPDEEFDVSKQCMITPLNPIEDFNKLLKNGFNADIVCTKMHDVTLNLIEFSTSLEDLMKPVDTLKALREFYIINNDAKSYNDFMYLVKDALVMSDKGSMWSKFINSGGIGLITNAEIEASDISQELSEAFKKLSGDLDIDFIIDGVVK
ncbi:unnamed protein product [Macrosiphum euphorbiae]|uniref:Uncharacterized protein n=1 Tax=Macrosiphum euphorbiae TaxID=13131 RepID=A0AAV0XX91_9HEMI|nr:unnamed protein product [Macrosiphum euphorbiae]